MPGIAANSGEEKSMQFGSIPINKTDFLFGIILIYKSKITKEFENLCIIFYT
jgi:hypothetical protein